MKKADLSKLQSLKKELKILKKSCVKIGVAGDVGTYKNRQSILDNAYRHEYGIGVPRRSFLREPFYKKQDEVNKAISAVGAKVLNAQSSAVKELNNLAIFGENIVKNAFKTANDGSWEELADSTKRLKKENRILFDTGRLVQSIRGWVADENTK